MQSNAEDAQAIARLLEEKEKDLELAAKIGQELLERNEVLNAKITSLEMQVIAANEMITQLRHELQVKTDLLHVYSDNEMDLELDSSSNCAVSIKQLQKRIIDLEVENKRLQEEASALAKESMEVEEVEEKEERLKCNALKHLTEARVQISHLSEEFSRKSDESMHQKEEITRLLSQVCSLKNKAKAIGVENEELHNSLHVYKETQAELSAELLDFKEKYSEVLELLHEVQEELRRARKKGQGGRQKSVMLDSFADQGSRSVKTKGDFISLEAELYASLHSSEQFSERDPYHSLPMGSDLLASEPRDDYTWASEQLPETGTESNMISQSLASQRIWYGSGEGAPRTVSRPGSGEAVSPLLETSHLRQACLVQAPCHQSLYPKTPEEPEEQVWNKYDALPSSPPGNAQRTSSHARGYMSNGGSLMGSRLDHFSSSHISMSSPDLTISGHSYQRPLTRDSGVMSGDFQEYEGSNPSVPHSIATDSVTSHTSDQDLGQAVSEEVDDFRYAVMIEDPDEKKIKLAPELEDALRDHDPARVEKRFGVKMGSSKFSYDLGSDGFDSPGSLIGKPGFHFLPCGVHTPDSVMSMGSQYAMSDSSNTCSAPGYGHAWKLPDKLRVVKPLEGSLTLHHWQHLAMPHLGNLFEEHSGVTVKQAIGKIHKTSPELVPEEADQKIGEIFPCNTVVIQAERTNTQQTFADSTVLHPDDRSCRITIPSTYGKKAQASPEFSQSFSKMEDKVSPALDDMISSCAGSVRNDLRQQRGSKLTPRIGLAQVLDDRHIHGYLSSSNTSLNDTRDDTSIALRTITSHSDAKQLSPACSPRNSGINRPVDLGPDERTSSSTSSSSSPANNSLIQVFFKGLKAALYRKQEPQNQSETKRSNSRKEKHDILKEVEETDHTLCSSTRHPSPLESEHDKPSNPDPGSLSTASDKPGGAIPGSVPLPGASLAGTRPTDDLTIGQLSHPWFSLYRRPSLRPRDFGHVPDTSTATTVMSGISLVRDSTSTLNGRGPGRGVGSFPEKGHQLIGAFGVPGTPGTGALNIRQDLGSVPLVGRRDSPDSNTDEVHDTFCVESGFIGSMTSMFFGRKGGFF